MQTSVPDTLDLSQESRTTEEAYRLNAADDDLH
jgi:hypothetical protein